MEGKSRTKLIRGKSSCSNFTWTILFYGNDLTAGRKMELESRKTLKKR